LKYVTPIPNRKGIENGVFGKFLELGDLNKWVGESNKGIFEIFKK
jgi:hypothetical protein